MAERQALQELRKFIRQQIEEAVNNFKKKPKETASRQLKDASSPKKVGDPMDVKLNQHPSRGGSDGKNAPTVSVSAGAAKGSSKTTAGQAKAIFSAKTKRAKK